MPAQRRERAAAPARKLVRARAPAPVRLLDVPRAAAAHCARRDHRAHSARFAHFGHHARRDSDYVLVAVLFAGVLQVF